MTKGAVSGHERTLKPESYYYKLEHRRPVTFLYLPQKNGRIWKKQHKEEHAAERNNSSDLLDENS